MSEAVGCAKSGRAGAATEKLGSGILKAIKHKNHRSKLFLFEFGVEDLVPFVIDVYEISHLEAQEGIEAQAPKIDLI